MEKLTLILFGAVLLASCTKHAYLHKINGYLNAHSAEARGRFLAEGYHGFFAEKKGTGKDKQTALQSFMQWDGPMEPDIKISGYAVNGNIWRVTFNEQNDFTKLIGFPGWKGAMVITFASNKLIKETIYLPDDTNPEYKPYLLPAIAWLQQNKPAELNEIYKGGHLVQTTAAANKWKELLRAWKAQTGGK